MKNLADYAGRIKYYDEVPSKGARICVYSPPGGGKTHFCGTAPAPFVIDADKGGATLSALHIPHLTLEFGERGNLRQVERILIDARDHTGPFAPGGPLADRSTICIDSYTSLSEIVLDELMRYPENPRWKAKDPLKEKPEFDHWGAHLAYFVQISHILEDIAQHSNVIVTAIARINDDPAIQKTKGLPDINGQFRGKMARFFDYVLLLEDTGKEYVAYTRPHGLYIAKTRRALPEVLQDPKFEDLK